MKFHKISHDGGYDIKVILANTKYEAIGFYLMEEVDYVGSESLDRVEVLPNDHEVKVSCIGFPIYKTLEEIHKEKDDWTTPQTITGLVE